MREIKSLDVFPSMVSLTFRGPIKGESYCTGGYVIGTNESHSDCIAGREKSSGWVGSTKVVQILKKNRGTLPMH